MPGAMDAFVKAAREAFNDENIGTPELFKLMEGGKLLSKDILPLVGKYMSEAAKKGGALEKMLNSNGVAMRRLQQTWTSFQNEVFMGGFGEALTRTFNALAFSLKNNEQLAKSLGGVFGGLVDGFIYFYGTIHDYSILAWDAINTEFLTPLKEAIPILNEVGAKDAAWLAGWIIAAGIFKNIAGFLGSIVAALIKIPKLLPAALPGVEAATAGTASAAGGGLFSSLGSALYGFFAAKDFPLFPLTSYVDREKELGLSPGSLKHSPGLRDVLAEWGISTSPDYSIPAALVQQPMPFSPLRAGAYIPGSVNKPMEPQEMKIKVMTDGTKFSEIIRLEIEDSNNKVLNQLSD